MIASRTTSTAGEVLRVVEGAGRVVEGVVRGAGVVEGGNASTTSGRVGGRVVERTGGAVRVVDGGFVGGSPITTIGRVDVGVTLVAAVEL